MQRYILRYGIMSGLTTVVMASLVWLMSARDPSIMTLGVVVGFAAMVLSMVFVFLGVRAFRTSLEGAPLSFWMAFRCGGAIALCTCLFYVVGWEITYATAFPDFAERYAESQKMEMRRTTSDKVTLQQFDAAMQEFVRDYHNVFIRVPHTAGEIAPIALLAVLVAAAVYRSK